MDYNVFKEYNYNFKIAGSYYALINLIILFWGIISMFFLIKMRGYDASAYLYLFLGILVFNLFFAIFFTKSFVQITDIGIIKGNRFYKRLFRWKDISNVRQGAMFHNLVIRFKFKNSNKFIFGDLETLKIIKEMS